VIFYEVVAIESERSSSRAAGEATRSHWRVLEGRLSRSEQLRGVLREDRPLYPPDVSMRRRSRRRLR
jgi:hypothetical protein